MNTCKIIDTDISFEVPNFSAYCTKCRIIHTYYDDQVILGKRIDSEVVELIVRCGGCSCKGIITIPIYKLE
jgi:hypothetical protein